MLSRQTAPAFCRSTNPAVTKQLPMPLSASRLLCFCQAQNVSCQESYFHTWATSCGHKIGKDESMDLHYLHKLLHDMIACGKSNKLSKISIHVICIHAEGQMHAFIHTHLQKYWQKYLSVYALNPTSPSIGNVEFDSFIYFLLQLLDTCVNDIKAFIDFFFSNS